MTQQKRVGRAMAAVGLFAIAVATLTPVPLNESRVAETPFWCLVCGQLGLIDVILNVALFLPLGVGLRMLGWPLAPIAIASFLVSSAVESLQVIAIAGRDASVSDLITNTSGGMLGAFLAHRWQALAFPTPRRAGRLLAAGALAVLGIFLSTAALLRPDLPAETWYWTVAPAWPGYGVFEGDVLEVRVGDRPVPRDTLPHVVDYHAAFLSGDPIFVRFVVGRGTPIGLAPIAALASADHRSLALLAQHGRKVTASVRLRANAWRLRPIRIRLNRVIPEHTGDTVVVWGGLDRGQLYAGAVSNQRRHSRRLPLTVALGWALLLPIWWNLGPETRVFNALWLGALIVPLAYWATGTRRIRSGFGVVLTVIFLGLGVVPRLFDLAPSSGVHWFAAGGGIVLGVLAARQARKRRGMDSRPLQEGLSV